ncbi:NUDIX hydrolase [Vibrio sp. 10N.237.312.C02]|uniref:NUDIX hydrolase n=1 Tax=Vibrio TaxID=662 RepID=UPI002732334A|nr:NUDIX hydrolase [Vibrio splendidus]MDP2589631.1 NUDIX hydrolase [Vibrio splendidus]
MLRFDQGNARFNCRSAAVIIDEDHVLLHRLVGDPFWALPGGKVEFFENSDDTLKRELLEELSIDSVVERHLWYVESFFEFSGKKYHELANYFLVRLSSPQKLPKTEAFRGIESDVDLEFRWFPLTDLANIDIRPRFLCSGLLDLPPETRYIKLNESAAYKQFKQTVNAWHF